MPIAQPMRARGIILSLVSSLALGACAGPAPTAPAGGAPTFVSLNPCLDAILVEVAEDDQILALSHYSRDPAASSMDVARAQQFGVTGGTAEEVISLQPDIVLASNFLAPATHSALERAGLTVETFGSATSVEVSQDQVKRMGELAGSPDRASLVADALNIPLWPPLNIGQPDGAAWPERGEVADPTLLLWQPGQIVAGEQSLIAQLIAEEGFTSYTSDLGLGQADYVSLEMVMSNPPDILLVAGESAGQQHPALSQLGGTQVHNFEPTLFYCGGPSIVAARERLNDLRMGFSF